MGQPKRRSDEERKKRRYRIIYEAVFNNPRIYKKDITSLLHVNPRTVTRDMKEAVARGYIVGPHIRRRSYANMREYMYFANCKKPFETYSHYGEDMRVVYHARMHGFVNTWLTSKEEIDIEGDVLLKGPRSDYYTPFTPNHSWEKAIEIMEKKAENFNPKEYEPKGILQTHWDETIEWDLEDEKLYREFKYNAREALTPIMRQNLISGQKIYEFLKRLPECCTISVNYFPDSISSYDPYLFVFETDYEDFIIDLFSELPTSSFFFKVSDKLLMYGYIERHLLRCSGLGMANIGQLRIPLLMRELMKKGIIQDEEQAIVAYHWRKNL